MNDWTPQEFLISLDFLNDGKFLSETAADGINAPRNPQDYQIRQAVVTSKDSLSIKLAPGGGFLCRISVK
jgi:alpha-glucosidase